MITSTQNPRIKWVRSLQSNPRARRESKAFVIEGVRIAEEAFKHGLAPELILYTADLNPRAEAVLQKFSARGVNIEQVSDKVMQAASDTQTSQGILIVLPLTTLHLRQDPEFVLIPDSVRDPGNLGTMMRTADAAGVDAVFIPPGTVDPYSPKVIRSGMGAHFNLPVHTVSWEEITPNIASHRVFLASAEAGEPYYRMDMQPPLAVIIGGEASGASQEARNIDAEMIHIPMDGSTESLNAAVAAGILLFEAARQRETKGKNELGPVSP